MSDSYVLRPIAHVRSAFTSPDQVPKGPGAEHTAEGLIEMLPEFADGLLDIEGFSHLYVLWVFDRADGFSLQATPPTDDRPHGVFATRSPRSARLARPGGGEAGSRLGSGPGNDRRATRRRHGSNGSFPPKR